MWQGGMHGRVCVVGGMCGKGACVVTGMHGGMHSGGVCGGGHAGWGGIRGTRDSHCSGRYVSYWNAFLLLLQRVDVTMKAVF